MDSSVSPKDKNWFLRLCHHISNAVYHVHKTTAGPCPESIFIHFTSINHVSRGFVFMLSFCLCQRSFQVFQHICCMNFWAYLICVWDTNSPFYPWFCSPNNIHWRAQTMKFPNLHLLCSTYSHLHLVGKSVVSTIIFNFSDGITYDKRTWVVCLERTCLVWLLL